MVLQYLSIILEAIVAVFGILIAKKKDYGWFIFLTFAIYVFYDLSKFLEWQISSSALYLLFFIASLSALIAVLLIYKRK